MPTSLVHQNNTTMNAKHTPGPWDYFIGSATGKGLIRIEQAETGKHIASLTRGEENIANASIMSAAPAMLEVLKSLCGIEAWITDPEMKRLFQEKVYSVINQAEGTTA